MSRKNASVIGSRRCRCPEKRVPHPRLVALCREMVWWYGWCVPPSVDRVDRTVVVVWCVSLGVCVSFDGGWFEFG